MSALYLGVSYRPPRDPRSHARRPTRLTREALLSIHPLKSTHFLKPFRKCTAKFATSALPKQSRRQAVDETNLQVLPGNGPRARHANELQCSACRLRTPQPRIRVIAFAMNTSAYQVLWCNAFRNSSRGDCKTLLDHKLSILQSSSAIQTLPY